MLNYKRYFSYNGLVIVFFFFSFGMLMSCSHKVYTGSINYNFKSKDGRPDYSNLNYWAANPFKPNPSDNVPRDLANEVKEFFEGKPLGKQLVCAYIIGLPVFTDYFSELKPCADSTATGCFIGWRTFKEGYVAPFVEKETQKAYVINPLAWTMDTALAPTSLDKGGVLRNFNKVIPGLEDAQIHGNVLWVNKPKFFGSVFLKIKNYHIADYNLFYENIRENVGVRIKAFLKK